MRKPQRSTSRRVIKGCAATIITACLMSCLHHLTFAQDKIEALPQVVQNLLQRRLLKQKLPPRFEIENDSLDYDLGYFDFKARTNWIPDEIIEPVKAQFQIEEIERNWFAQDKALFLKPYLEKYKQSLGEAWAKNDRNALRASFSNLKQGIIKAVSQYAFENKLLATNFQHNVQEVNNAVKYKVFVTTLPEGGKVLLVEGLEWQIAQALKVEPPWIEVVQKDSPIELGGTYHYRLTWPGGGHAENEFKIMKDDTIELKPE